MYISIIIPAHNEERRIQKALGSIAEYLGSKKYESEVIVVDDGSSDRTAEVVGEFAAKYPGIRLLQNEKNMGKGYSVRRGVLAAAGELVFFTDADLATPIGELDKFLAAIEGSDIVIGSRALEGSRIVVHAPLHREILGRIFSALVRSLGVAGFADTQCGAKLFKKAAAGKIFPLQKVSRFAFDVELLYLAELHGFRVKEIPVDWFHSADTRVRALPDGIRMLADLVRIRFMHRKPQ